MLVPPSGESRLRRERHGHQELRGAKEGELSPANKDEPERGTSLRIISVIRPDQREGPGSFSGTNPPALRVAVYSAVSREIIDPVDHYAMWTQSGRNLAPWTI